MAFSILSDFNFCVLVLILTVVIYIVRPKRIIKKSSPKLYIFGYRLFYSDTRGDKKKKNVIYSKILHSEKHDISGKPDYIYKKILGRKMIPVELKSGVIEERNMPYKGDLLQLVAYFLIIEDVYGVRPKKGRLVYKDCMFKIKNTRSLRNEVIRTLNDMRNMLDTGEGQFNDSFVKCRYCICKGTVCKKTKKD